MTCIPRRRQDRGAELVELAVGLPLLLLVFGGIVDFGFLFRSYEVVTNAAREGARVRVLPGYSDADAQARVASYVSAAGLSGTPTTTVTAVTIPAPGGTTFPGVQVGVSYTHQFTFIGPFVAMFGGSFAPNVTFTARSTMRTEVVSAGGS